MQFVKRVQNARERGLIGIIQALVDGYVVEGHVPIQAMERLLAARQIRVVRARDEGCCGGLALHLGEEAVGLATMAAMDTSSLSFSRGVRFIVVAL